MAQLLTDADILALPSPAAGNRITYDTEVKGFGVRVTSAGAKAFILNYRQAGREKRLTIGACTDWKVKAARDHAKALNRHIDVGADPMAERHAERAAPTIDTLADRFIDEHLAKRRPETQRTYKSALKHHIRPALGKMKVADVRHADVERLHNKVAQTAPYQANRVVAVLSKMMGLAVKWQMRADNPVIGIERAPEEKRERFLSPAEIARLIEALAAHKEAATANVIRLPLLTGARKSEALTATWDQFDIQAGVWTKPSSHTKQKKMHRVPLSAPAKALLAALYKERDENCAFVFPGPDGKEPLTDIKHSGLSICRAAGLAVQVPAVDAKGKPALDAGGQPVMAWQSTVRIHDLRHSYASILVSGGASLPLIGALLGHASGDNAPLRSSDG